MRELVGAALDLAGDLAEAQRHHAEGGAQPLRQRRLGMGAQDPEEVAGLVDLRQLQRIGLIEIARHGARPTRSPAWGF